MHSNGTCTEDFDADLSPVSYLSKCCSAWDDFCSMALRWMDFRKNLSQVPWKMIQCCWTVKHFMSSLHEMTGNAEDLWRNMLKFSMEGNQVQVFYECIPVLLMSSFAVAIPVVQILAIFGSKCHHFTGNCVFFPQIAIAIGVLTSNMGGVTTNFGSGRGAIAIAGCYGWGEGDDQLWGSGRGGAGCHCSVLWLGGGDGWGGGWRPILGDWGWQQTLEEWSWCHATTSTPPKLVVTLPPNHSTLQHYNGTLQYGTPL